MDTGKINVNSSQSQQLKQASGIQNIAKMLNISAGTSFAGEVSKIQPASAEVREQLNQLIEQQLKQLNSNSSSPATRSLIDQLLVQKNIIQSPSLLLATITTANQRLLSYTNLPLEQGQLVQLALLGTSKLIIQGLLISDSLGQKLAPLPTNQTLTPSPHAYPKLSPNQAIPSQLISGAQTTAKDLALINKEHILRDNLANLLPLKDKTDNLLKSLDAIIAQINKLPSEKRGNWLSSKLQAALQQISKQISAPNELTSAKKVAAALHQNGVFFEQKLSKLVGQVQDSTNNSALTKTGNINNAGAQTSGAVNTKIAALNHELTLGANQKGIDKAIAQDLKGALLASLSVLNEELSLSTLALDKIANSTISNLSLKDNSIAAILLQFTNRSLPELPQKVLRNQLLQLLHQHTINSLAKIQLQQLSNLSSQNDKADASQPQQLWQLEIPIRHGHDIHHLSIHMQYRWVNEEKDNSDSKEAPTKTKQWQIMLSFDLPNIGKLFTQISLRDNQVSTIIWADNEKTYHQAQEKLNRLREQFEHEGLNVTQMQCFNGTPPQQKMSLSYSLVDVKT